jgi:hypothetical protein
VTEFDIAIDTGNSDPEFFVVGVDFGALTTGDFDGRIASFILDAAGNLVDVWVPDAPMNGSTSSADARERLGLRLARRSSTTNWRRSRSSRKTLPATSLRRQVQTFEPPVRRATPDPESW